MTRTATEPERSPPPQAIEEAKRSPEEVAAPHRAPASGGSPQSTAAASSELIRRIAGLVRSADGPATDAEVGIYAALPETECWTLCGLPYRSRNEPLAHGRTDASGRFELAVDGTDRLYVRATHAGFAPTEIGPFEASSNETLEHLEIVLDEGGTIEGHVLDEKNQPVPDVAVSGSRGDGFIERASSGPDGSYRMAGLAAGAWCVRPGNAELDRSSTKNPGENSIEHHAKPCQVVPSCTVRSGQTTRFDLALGARVRVSVFARIDGRASVGSVALTKDDEQFGRTTWKADADGAYRLLGVGPGRYRIRMVLDAGGTGIPLYADRMLDLGDNVIRTSFATGSLEVHESTPDIYVLRCQVDDGFEAIVGEFSGDMTFEALPTGTWSAKKRKQTDWNWIDCGEVQVKSKSRTKLDLP